MLIFYCKRILFFSFFFLLINSFSFSQVVNIESKRFDGKEIGWHGSAEVNLSFVRNTKDIWQMGQRSRLQKNRENNMLLLLSDFGLVKAGGEDFVNRGFGHIRYSSVLNPSRSIWWESFAQSQYNQVQKLKLRILLGSGFRFRILHQDSLAVNTGALIMAEYQDFSGEDPIRRNFRMSSYLSFSFQTHSNIEVGSTTYYQPVVTKFSDYRIADESYIAFRFAKRWQFKTTFNMVYDSNPPIAIPSLSFSLVNGFNFKF